GYDPRALPAQTVLAWIVLLACYLWTDPADNINWVFGPGAKPQRRLPARVYLLLLMVFLPVGIYLPTHYLLLRAFSTDVSPVNASSGKPGARVSAPAGGRRKIRLETSGNGISDRGDQTNWNGPLAFSKFISQY